MQIQLQKQIFSQFFTITKVTILCQKVPWNLVQVLNLYHIHIMFSRNTFCFIYYTLFLIQAYFSHQKVRTIFKGRKNVRRKHFLSVGPEKSRGSEKYEMQKEEGREVEWRATNPWMNETKRQKDKQKERI